ILCGSNPGNVGHGWVKRAFIEPKPPMEIWRAPKSEGGMLRQFIPAKLQDNPSLMETDPNYSDRLEGLGSAALVEAMKDGSWDVIEGAFFDKWSYDRNVVEPFAIPESWGRFASMDWGYAKPFSCHWWAVADGDYGPFPRGSLICYREFYGQADDSEKMDVGVRMEAEDFRDKFLEMNGDDELAYMVVDPAAWGTQSGPSVAEKLFNKGEGIKNLRKAVNRRVGNDGAAGGWDEMRARIKGVECNDGVKRPLLYFFSTAVHAIRTIPELIHDKVRPEDLNTKQEDHAADDTRYACMTRPIVKRKKGGGKPAKEKAGTVIDGKAILPGLSDDIGLSNMRDVDR
ncbi:MAG: hypothetical protein AB8B85_10695, partial [Paracoccaceae bacterium]